MSLSEPPKTLRYYTTPPAVAPGGEIFPVVFDGDSAEERVIDPFSFVEMPASAGLPITDLKFRWIHFILGCGVLLPWNVIITALPYFLSRLDGSLFIEKFSSYLMVTITASNLISLAHATFTTRQTSHSQRVRRCLICLSISCLLMTFSTFINLTGGAFGVFILIIGAIQIALGSYMLASVVAVASLFGPQTMQSMMSGQAAIAVVVSSVQVLGSALFLWRQTPDSIATNAVGQAEKESARIFFGLSTLFLIICAVAHNILVSKPTYKALVVPPQRKCVPGTGSTDDQLLISWQGKHSREWDRVLRVANLNLTFELTAAYIYIITLAVFPAISTSVQPTNPGTHPLLFNAIHFLVFSCGDFLGRPLCNIPCLVIWSANWQMVLSLSRTLLIPIFLMCNVRLHPSSDLPTTPYINSDLFFMVILFVFGLSNGYLSTVCMMAAPSLEHNPRLKGRKDDLDVAATLTNFAMVGGLAVGSVASFAVRAAICKYP